MKGYRHRDSISFHCVHKTSHTVGTALLVPGKEMFNVVLFQVSVAVSFSLINTEKIKMFPKKGLLFLCKVLES